MQTCGSADSAGLADRHEREAVEHMLLVALESLYEGDREVDVRAGLLRVVLLVLRQNGARFVASSATV